MADSLRPAPIVTPTASVDGKSAKKGKRKKNFCFVISPFGGYYDRYFEDVYGPAVIAAGLDAKRADDLYRPSAIINDIWTYVREAKLLLADLTGKNPNVFYELGLAHACSKPVVLLTQSIEDVPFDLRSLRVIPYDLADPAWSSILRVSITTAIEEVLAAPLQSVLPTFHLNSGGFEKKSEPIEKRLAAMEFRLSRLTSENNSLLRMRGGHSDITGPDEARALMRDLLSQGLSPGSIIDILSTRGVPRGWVETQLPRYFHSARLQQVPVSTKKRKNKKKTTGTTTVKKGRSK